MFRGPTNPGIFLGKQKISRIIQTDPLSPLTLHGTRRTPHGASRLVLAMSAWSVKTRRAPSRRCRDARVYGHTTTAMHGNEYPPPPRCLCYLYIVLVYRFFALFYLLFTFFSPLLCRFLFLSFYLVCFLFVVVRFCSFLFVFCLFLFSMFGRSSEIRHCWTPSEVSRGKTCTGRA